MEMEVMVKKNSRGFKTGGDAAMSTSWIWTTELEYYKEPEAFTMIKVPLLLTWINRIHLNWFNSVR